MSLKNQYLIPALYSLFFFLFFLIIGSLFLPFQSIWADEIAQITGLALPLDKVIPWLLGEDIGHQMLYDTYDRTPPLSYFIGKSWVFFCGSSIPSLRWMGFVFGAMGAAILFYAARKHFGLASAIITCFLYTLSPNIITYANEIRSYPIFLFLSVIGLYFYLNLLQRCQFLRQSPYKTDLIFLTLTAVVAVYTHYYGVIFGYSILCSLFFFKGIPYRWIFMAIVFMTFCSLGIIPFIAGTENEPDTGLGGGSILRLLYRLVSHPAISMSYFVASLLVLSTLSLFVAPLYHKRSLYFLLLPCILGLVPVVVARFFLSQADWTAPHYSLWILPFLSLFFGAQYDVTQKSALWIRETPKSFKNFFLNRLFQTTISVLVLSVLACHIYGGYMLIRFPDYFSHGQFEELARIIAKYPEDKSIILHEAGEDHNLIDFLLQGRYPQLQDREIAMSELSSYEVVILYEAKVQNTEKIRLAIQEGSPNWPIRPTGEALVKSGHWKLIEKKKLEGFVGIQIYIFRKMNISSDSRDDSISFCWKF